MSSKKFPRRVVNRKVNVIRTEKKFKSSECRRRIISRYGESILIKGRWRIARQTSLSREVNFRRRLLIPEVCRAIQSSLHRVVYDEIHLAEGTNGGHLRGLFNHETLKKRFTVYWSSATIASPEQHVEAIWGVEAQTSTFTTNNRRSKWCTRRHR